MLICTVRDCGERLVRHDRALLCARGHSFDIAREGYVNLLQPQDRRSVSPGDSAEAVAARRRLHDLGVTRPLFEGICDAVRVSPADVVLDAGCGEGFYAGNLSRTAGCAVYGVDISTPAIRAAAQRYPDGHWVVANADRFLPYADESFSMVLSITSRMNSSEFRRVLKRGGRLLVALAAPDDLIELRGTGRDRVARTIEMFAAEFRILNQRRVTTTADLDASALRDVLTSIYRPMRREEIVGMRVTFSLDLLLFESQTA
jgi:23S rRNA (guanine745-N1)-methyltransferase